MITGKSGPEKANKTSGSTITRKVSFGGLTLPAVPVLQKKPNDKESISQKGSRPAVAPFAGIPVANNTGLPAGLKNGIENLSGFSMDDVKVHYNSGKPAQLQAHAYAHGTNIHLAPGQEKHLAHEAWHVVQQKQGRVSPTIQKKGVTINDDTALEAEADVMGLRAANVKPETYQRKLIMQAGQGGTPIAQRVEWEDDDIDAIRHYNKIPADDETEAQKNEHIAQIRSETTPLSNFHGIEFNCFAWALGLVAFDNPGDKLATWKHRLGEEYEFSTPAAESATILLWGEAGADDGETVVNHASVKLTRAQLKTRKNGDYSAAINITDEAIDNLPDPFWSSAAGAGYGVMSHPRDFYANGEFGPIIAGMRKK